MDFFKNIANYYFKGMSNSQTNDTDDYEKELNNMSIEELRREHERQMLIRDLEELKRAKRSEGDIRNFIKNYNRY
ncbi:hypothetical protein [Anoxybacillus gonensis]|uniref:hypothetical protein n=1 Tax=Anoxybacillus gonensis TaxID=198467 RepID=UPI0002BE35AC|nr:hypothetical protein [Anoxybacillus gonensis]EMI11248.1 hypothetical protein F510_0661 [Anoxybacillus gonensis]